jgi:integral membrane protein
MSIQNRTYLQWLILMGLVEGTSTLLLFLVAMPLKYYGGIPEAVRIAGSIHGLLFLALVAMFILGRSIVPLSTRMVWFGVIGAILPFGPFIVDVPLVRMLRASDDPSGSARP